MNKPGNKVDQISVLSSWWWRWLHRGRDCLPKAKNICIIIPEKLKAEARQKFLGLFILRGEKIISLKEVAIAKSYQKRI
jgi:hypothetical protein